MADIIKVELTIEGKKQLEEELAYLKDVRRPENRKALAEARAQGDYSENADLDAARNEQALIEGRIQQIEETLKYAIIIQPKAIDVADIGNMVDIKYIPGDMVLSIKLVGREESDPFTEPKKIAMDTPIGQALKGHKQGDKVSFKSDTKKEYTVEILKVYR